MQNVKQAGVSRRGFSAAFCAGSALAAFSQALAQPGAKYLVGTTLQQGLAGKKVATCAELDRQIAYLQAEAKRAATEPDKVGGEILARYKKQQKALDEAVVLFVKTNDTVTIEQHINRAGTAVGLSIAACLLFVPSKVALGVAAAVEVLKAPTKLVVQAFYLPDQNKPDMLVGYAEDRVAYFGGEVASAMGKKVLQGMLTAVGHYFTASEWANDSNTVDKARVDLAFASNQLKLVVAGLNELGSDAKKWATLYREAAEAGAKSLKGFRDATAATSCLLASPPKRTLK